MYGWNDKPNKAKYTGTSDGVAHFDAGEYTITVDVVDGETEVTYRHKTRHTSRPDHTFENMVIEGGVMKIPVSDMAAEVLKRLAPVDLALALWENQEVKDAFVECIGARWDGLWTDDDRRKILHSIKESVHDQALDKLGAFFANTLEHAARNRTHYMHSLGEADTAIRRYEEDVVALWNRSWPDLEAPELPKLPRVKHIDHDPEYRIGGKHWNEARDYWRKLVAERFLGPTLERRVGVPERRVGVVDRCVLDSSLAARGTLGQFAVKVRVADSTRRIGVGDRRTPVVDASVDWMF